MERRRLLPRFSVQSILVLMLGIAIGVALKSNEHTIQSWLHPALSPAAPRAWPPPPYRIEPPDILNIALIEEPAQSQSGVTGQHLVGPDGRINLGTLGSVYVTGITIDEAREAVEQMLASTINSPQVTVDVMGYNSKKYYVVVQGPNGTGNVTQCPITGNETVLDAIARVGGISQISSIKMWIARPAPNGVGNEQILPIKWDDIASGASTSTNYQLLPGDRLHVARKRWW
jgi:protein involved in polysaccharide export with SLBB domain